MALKEPIFHMEEQFGHQQQPVRTLFQAARKDPAERGSGQLSLMLDHAATFVPIWSILRQFSLLWIKMWVRDLNMGWVCLCKCVACSIIQLLSLSRTPTLLYAAVCLWDSVNYISSVPAGSPSGSASMGCWMGRLQGWRGWTYVGGFVTVLTNRVWLK